MGWVSYACCGSWAGGSFADVGLVATRVMLGVTEGMDCTVLGSGVCGVANEIQLVSSRLRLIF